MPRCVFSLACTLLLMVSSSLLANPPKRVDFAREILPILSDKCFVCHGPDTQDDSELRLDSFDSATSDRGGYQALNPDEPIESELLNRIFSDDDPMPPIDAEKALSADEKNLLRQWILEGGEYAKHWSFVKPEKELPETVKATGVTNVIDELIGAKLESARIDFAPEADRATLARRAALTLTGLPPEPEQLASFMGDSSGTAFETYVDRLIASPRFGEHQARYWLDAVRYGDTHGLHLDNRRGIYPYRDWVVRAINDNLPMDEFIRWQLAGDLHQNANLAQQLATGFVRMNPTTSEGGAIPAEFQAKNNFDRVETLGTVLLGMSFTCARCHTHKYDPITQKEYYQLFAFFNNTAESSMDGNSYEYGPIIRAPKDQAAWIVWDTLQQEIEKLCSQVDISTLGEDVQQQWQDAKLAQRISMLASADETIGTEKSRERAQELSAALKEVEANFTTSLVAKDLAQPRETRLLKRGEYNLPAGDALQPGVPAVMGGFPEDAPRNRLGLAHWLTSREHPLVARVVANQLWQHIFSDGLVRTPEDFGLQGEQPTHPVLLDWLAVELQDSGWNRKHMLREMVLSRTFRQDSSWRKDIDDPENRLFSRGPSYRLDAEVLRDIGLWASHLLDPHMGGEGIKPYQPGGMWLAMAHPASNTKKYERDQGQRLYRRSLYVYWKRTSPHPMMTLFDAPDRESSCVQRSRTNTSLQSLGLLNETQRIEMSRKLAERLIKERENDADRLDLLFSLLASRNPTPSERTACESLLETMRERYQAQEKDATELVSVGDANRDPALASAEVAAWTQVAVIVLASDTAILLY